MENNYIAFSGVSNVGNKMKINEDYISFDDNQFGDDIVYFSIADGSGSKESMFRPAAIVSNQALKYMARFFKKDEKLFKGNIRTLMEESVLSANDVLCGFKLGAEESRMEFASSFTCATLERNGVLTFAHAGNTRLYLIRDQRTVQLTTDHTIGQKLVDKQAITEEEYYTAIERLQLYNELGMVADPSVQTARVKLKKNDVVIMTTDGIHYNFRKEAFLEILLSTQTMDEAAQEMVKTALDLKTYPDNISVIIAWYLGSGMEESQ